MRLLGAVLLVAVGCSGGGPDASRGSRTDAGAMEPAPVLEQLQPSGTLLRFVFDADRSGVTVTLLGSGFSEESRVRIPGLTGDSKGIVPVVVSPTELRVVLEHSWLTMGARTLSFEVRTNQGTSNRLSFAITNPPPTLAGVGWRGTGERDATYELGVWGRGFVEGVEILWNGKAYPGTVWIPGKNAYTSVAGSLVGGAACEVAVRNPPPGGGTSSLVTCPMRVFSDKMFLDVHRMIWDSTRRRLYASCPTCQAVAVIDPEDPGAVRYLGLTNYPRPLALTADARYLYAGGSAIQRIDLSTEQVDLEIPLGANAGGVPVGATYLSVAPTRPGRIAVSLDGSDYYLSPLVVFEEGQRLPTPRCSGCGIHVFSADETLYAINNQSSSHGLYNFQVSATGVTQRFMIPGGVAGTVLAPPIIDEGRLLVATVGPTNRAESIGQAIDLRSGLEVGRFMGARTIAVDRDAGRVLMADWELKNSLRSPMATTVWESDRERYSLLGSLEVWGTDGFPAELIRWGQNGLALSYSGRGVYLARLP